MSGCWTTINRILDKPGNTGDIPLLIYDRQGPTKIAGTDNPNFTNVYNNGVFKWNE